MIQKRGEGCLITDRDVRLLRDVYDNTVLSFAQIHERHFEGCAVSTVSNRLGKLVGAGFVRKHRVGMMIYHRMPKDIGVVFLVTRKGLAMLKARYPTERFRDDPVALNTSSLAHDLLLTDALASLERRFLGSHIVNGKLVERPVNMRARAPDAVVMAGDGSSKIAVELELSAKSDARYREIITSYRLSLDYEKVLYVTGSKAIADKLQQQISGIRGARNAHSLPTGKFYFVHLDALIAKPAGVAISNGEDELSTGAVSKNEGRNAYESQNQMGA